MLNADMPFWDVRLAARGSGAEMQRASASRRGHLTGVVDDLMNLTVRT